MRRKEHTDDTLLHALTNTCYHSYRYLFRPTLLGATSVSTASAHVQTPAANVQVSWPNETWRAYLLRMEADRLQDEKLKALPAWTVSSVLISDAKACFDGG
jgi:hypothetical protein